MATKKKGSSITGLLPRGEIPEELIRSIEQTVARALLKCQVENGKLSQNSYEQMMEHMDSRKRYTDQKN